MTKQESSEIELAGLMVPLDWARKLYSTASLHCNGRILKSRGQMPEIFTFTKAVAASRGDVRSFVSREECRLYIAGVYLSTADGRRKFSATFPNAATGAITGRATPKVMPVLTVVSRVAKALPFEATDAFLQSFAWRKARMKALATHGARCQCCGASPAATGAVMNVDHIKPRKTHPELALDQSNLQILCHECNHGKGNWDQTDWRAKA